MWRHSGSWLTCIFSHIVDLLLQSKFRLHQHVDLVLLGLEVIQNLLVGLLKSNLLSVQSCDGLIQNGHLLRQVLHLKPTKATSRPQVPPRPLRSSPYLVLHSVPVLLHFGESHFQVIHVSLQGHHLFLHLPLLGRQLGVHLLLILQAFLELLEFRLLSYFGLDQLVATVFRVFQIVLLLDGFNGKVCFPPAVVSSPPLAFFFFFLLE